MPGQGWPALDRGGRVRFSRKGAPVASDAGRSVWRESWRPRCPRAARLDIGRIPAISGVYRRTPADPDDLRVSRWGKRGSEEWPASAECMRAREVLHTRRGGAYQGGSHRRGPQLGPVKGAASDALGPVEPSASDSDSSGHEARASDKASSGQGLSAARTGEAAPRQTATARHGGVRQSGSHRRAPSSDRRARPRVG